LEHGYSVSDTDNENGGLLSGIGEHDILSLKSGLSLMGGVGLQMQQQPGQQQTNFVQSSTIPSQVQAAGANGGQNEMMNKLRAQEQ